MKAIIDALFVHPVLLGMLAIHQIWDVVTYNEIDHELADALVSRELDLKLFGSQLAA